MSKDRLRVVDRKEYVSLWDVIADNDVDTVKAEIDRFGAMVNYGQGETAKFVVEGYGYDGGVEVYFEISRDENDYEYNKRMEQNARAKEKARLAREKKKEKARQVLMESEEAERAEYVRLRAKFEVK